MRARDRQSQVAKHHSTQHPRGARSNWPAGANDRAVGSERDVSQPPADTPIGHGCSLVGREGQAELRNLDEAKRLCSMT